MSPGKINQRVVSDKVVWVERMVLEINKLPLESLEAFRGDNRNIWTAESCLRRALEGLMDLGRHILAKGFGQGVTEYKQIGQGLLEQRVFAEAEAELFKKLAGYRNRVVQYYQEISSEELYRISRDNLADINRLVKTILNWLETRPELVDRTL
jgi:uncharacterized protein YutE (UPF0331/DUF86 family)